MVDVLYIHPIGDSPNFAKRYYPAKENIPDHSFAYIPAGIIGIVNNLIKNGFSVRGLDLPLRKLIDKKFDLNKYIKTLNPKIILIDIHWYVHIKNGIEIAKIAKKTSDCEIIVGGMSATIFYKQLLNVKEIDYVIKGDGETPTLKLIEEIFARRKGEKVPNVASKKFDNPVKYACPDIDEYDYVNIDFLDERENYFQMLDFWIMNGKGCPYECKNCDGGKRETERLYCRNRLIFRNAEKIIEDLKNVKSNRACFVMYIDLMPDEVISKISKNKFNFSFRNEYFQLCDLKRLELYKNSFNFIELVFSPVSGSEVERKEYGKMFTNKEFLDMLAKIERMDLNAGVIIYFTDFMIYPDRKVELDKKAREELINKIEEVSPSCLIRVMPQIVDPGMQANKSDLNELFRLYSS